MNQTLASSLLGFSCLVSACGATVPEDHAAPPLGSAALPPDTAVTTTPSAPAPAPPSSTCQSRTETEATEGTPALDVKPCRFVSYDGVGAVLRIVRTFDGKQVLTEAYDRIDEPARLTEQDVNSFVVPPRHTKIRNEYDDANRLVHTWLDEGADGTTDLEDWWTFDAAGNETTSASAQGNTVHLTKRSFMQGGFLLTQTETNTTSDQPDDVRVLGTQTYTRRSDGAPLTHEAYSGHSPVPVESSTTWTYDANGVVTMIETSSYRVTTTLKDAAGKILEERYATHGINMFVHQYTYDAGGRLVRHRAFGRTGELGTDDKYTYDASGRLVEQWKQSGIGTRKGTTTDVETHTYDACGRASSITRTTNGAPISQVDRVYDQRGFVVSEEDRRFSPAPNTNRTTRGFDAQGRLTLIVTTSTTEPTRSESFTYDANGRLTLRLRERTPSSRGAIVREELNYACAP